ncbi:hypothetical protein DSO57_1003672 [Entomophthora muscae]|uniref:Uncharacterized protein n=1 Tax=Entomophthora muscae TaxID=34485 RepID=A0ACC2T858_9FUNG|nr:hypothetical protein DSO57_1003672 [Entomophthora muscae]
MTQMEIKRMRRPLKTRSQKLLSNQDEEKSWFAHVHVPPLSPPSPLPPEDPGAPGCVPQPETALIWNPQTPKSSHQQALA